MDVLQHKLLCSLQGVRNLADNENDFVPGCDSKIFLSPDPKHVIAEEGYSPLKIFDHLKKRIGKPSLSSKDFVKFSRNSYLLRVTKVDQGYKVERLHKLINY